MADSSKIEWTDATWNPIVGCSIVSPGCTNCYAQRMAARLEAIGIEHYAGTTKKVNGHVVWTGKVALAPDDALGLYRPIRWARPRRIFVNSMSDLFHEAIPDEWIDRVFAIMRCCPQHTFQVLTKRAERMREYMTTVDRHVIHQLEWKAVLNRIGKDVGQRFFLKPDRTIARNNWPPKTVWLGVSAERQQEADERIPLLLETPAAIRFVSIEPMLGPITLHPLTCGTNALSSSTGPNLDWVVIGGESGPGARPMHPQWPRNIRDQCAAAGVPYFFKQWGGWVPADDIKPERGDGIYIDDDGSLMTMPLGGGYDRAGINLAGMRRVGKKAAGRLLDGVEHSEFPAQP